MTNIRFMLAFLVTSLSLNSLPILAAEPTEDMRTMARMFVALEARNQKGYCTAMHTASYMDYLNRVCQSAVQNKLKKPEDCSPENNARELKADNEKCLAMPAAEFEQTVLRGREARRNFVQRLTTQGIDGDKLFQQERAK